MNEQLTNSVRAKIGSDTLLVLTIRNRQAGTLVNAEAYDLGNVLWGKVFRGELLSDRDRIDLCNYMLEYHTDWKAIAQTAIDELDAITKTPENI